MNRKHCPRCHGDVRLDRDEYGWYEQCIMCGYIQDLQLMATARKNQEPVKARREKSKITAS